MYIILNGYNYCFSFKTIITIYEEDRKEYYDALEKFNEELELNSLIDFLKLQLVKTWEKQLNKEKSTSLSLADFIN